MDEWEINAFGVFQQEELEILFLALCGYIADNEIHLGKKGFPLQSQLNTAWRVSNKLESEIQRRAKEYKDTPRNRME
jgi:hypothetical protein